MDRKPTDTPAAQAAAAPRRRGMLPASDAELRDVAMRVAAGWRASGLQLAWITPDAFEQAAVDFAVLLDERGRLGEDRRPLTLELNRLDKEINTRLSNLKGYIADAYGRDRAPEFYAEFGIVRQGKTWQLPLDRTERLHSLDLIVGALPRHKLDGQRYGLSFWKRLQNRYLELLADAEGTDQQLSARVRDKNELKAEIRKVLHSLVLLVQANHPDEWQAVLQRWGY